MNYGFLIDTKSCIGCHACSTACKSENQVPLGVNRTWVKYTEKGRYPDVTRHFQVTRCNHCSNPPCVRSCPVTAMYQRDDGIVEFDPDVCIGCKACMQACPYDAIYIDPDSHTAAKCHFCAHRVDVGLEPACVVVCPEHAIVAGDLDDPKSEIAQRVAKESVTVRKPEQGTAPKLFYVEGNELALSPTAFDDVPQGYMFADVVPDPHREPNLVELDASTALARGNAFSGTPIRTPQPQGQPTNGPIQFGGRNAGHMVQVGWNAQHEVPWHWPIPTYLVTKGLAAGLILILAPVVLGSSAASGSFVVGGFLSVLLMLVTTGLLLYDLERPERFLYLLVRPQWRSWVARAAWILSGFSILSGLWWLFETLFWFGAMDGGTMQTLRVAFAIPTLPLAVMTGIYTAFLFAQAEGRDFWQSPVTPVHMLLQMLYLGALGGTWVGAPDWVNTVALVTLIGSAAAILLGEFGVSRASEIAARAQHDIQWGRFRQHFWVGGLMVGHAIPLLLIVIGLPVLALPFAALGMFAYGYAFVMAPQQIPNS